MSVIAAGLLGWSLTAGSGAAIAGNDFLVSAQVRRQAHAPDQPVLIETTICNPHPEAIAVATACPVDSLEILDDSGAVIARLDEQQGCGGIISADTWGPFQCRRAHTVWPQVLGAWGAGQTARPAPRGRYHAVYRWHPDPRFSIEGGSRGFIAGQPLPVAVPALGPSGLLLLGLLVATLGRRRVAALLR